MLIDAKQKKKLLLSSDYLALIKFKQLRVAEEVRVVPPTKINERKTLWETKYKGMLDPLMPKKPMNHSTAGSGSATSLFLNSKPIAKCDIELEDDEFLCAVENV